MSEWHVGQTGNTGAGTRPGLAAALMLRVGGNQAVPNGSGTGTSTLAAGRTSFSDVLRERTAQQPTAVTHRNRKDSAPAVVASREPEAERRDVTDTPARSRDTVRSTREQASASREVEAKPADKAAPHDDDATAVANAGETTARETVSDVETEADEMAAVAQEPSPEAYANVLAMLLEAMQTAIEDLAEQAAAGAGDSVSVDAQTQVPVPAQVLETLTETIRQLLEGLTATGETTTAAQTVPLPQSLLQAIRTLLEQADTLKSNLIVQNPAAKADAMAGLLAQLQALANTVREQLQPLPAADITTSLAAETMDDALVSTVAAAGDAADAQSGETGEQGHGRETAPAFVAAANLTGVVQDPAMAAQGGVSAAAMAEGRTFGQEVARVAQANAPAAPQMPELPETARAVTSQVVTRLQTMSGDERHEMELQLKPENLGKIQLRVVEERGQILAKFTAESEKVRAILESNMQLLRDALEKNGMTIAELSVSVGQRQHNDTAEQAGARNGNGAVSGRGPSSGIQGDNGAPAEVDRELRMTRRIAEYLYGPDSTMSLKA
jgi:flagellar hook-length control protein FliK